MVKVSDAAKITQAHYRYQTGLNKERQDKEVKRKLGRIGYELDAKNTDKDVLVGTKGNNVHISFTGTDVKNPRDLLSDAALAVGIQKANPQFRERRKKTREIMRQYGDEKEYTLSGHSLGGSILMDTLNRSKSIRDRTSQAFTFNAGYTLPFHNSVKPADKKIKKELDRKVTHHRVKGDVVSAHMNKDVAFGQLAEYKSQDKDDDLFEKHGLSNFTEVDL